MANTADELRRCIENLEVEIEAMHIALDNTFFVVTAEDLARGIVQKNRLLKRYQKELDEQSN